MDTILFLIGTFSLIDDDVLPNKPKFFVAKTILSFSNSLSKNQIRLPVGIAVDTPHLLHHVHVKIEGNDVTHTGHLSPAILTGFNQNSSKVRIRGKGGGLKMCRNIYRLKHT